MKKTIVIVLSILILFTLFITWQRAKKKNAEDIPESRLKVVATIFPQYDFVREIAGDKVSLEMLIMPGAESHSYEPTPQDIIKIKNSDVFIYVGGESDEWINKILSSIDMENKKIITLMSIVKPVKEEIVEGMQEEEGGEEEEGEYDEHVWTSIKNAQKITIALSKMLQESDKENAEFYKQNTDRYIKELKALDKDFKEIVAKGKRKTIIFGDRFPFRYFADEYKLKYFAAFPGCSNETEANAATIAFLIDKVKEEKIPIVFYIEFSNEKIADIIASSAKAKTLLLHSAHNVSKKDFESGVSYLDIMKKNAQNLKEALWL
ncbi:MAG: metal ABC transporter substrate-binding protein [Elusimicrobiota bacterium]|jgi:zinc transport system substrate-binding protein|nr:metal ABC transporter substrate-binding protein [Elusimicrobiota bacterium]